MAHITLLRVIPTVTHNSDIVSDIPAGSIYMAYIYILTFSDILSGILSGTYSGILSGNLFAILSGIYIMHTVST